LLGLVFDLNILDSLMVAIDYRVNRTPFLKYNKIIWVNDELAINKYSFMQTILLLSAHLTFVYIIFIH
jgi:hypothetical protein